MAGSTTTTRTTSASRARSADLSVAPFQFEDLVQAYYDCRRNKRNTASARHFEKDMEINLLELHDDLIAGTYRPGRSICFVVTRLTAERDALQQRLNAADQRIDELVAELAKVRLGPCKMIVGDELP